jgi:Glycosyltransferase family 87
MSETPRLRRWLVATALLWMAVVNGVILWNTRVEIRRGYGDFASFYTAGTLVRRGLGAELYNPAAQWKVQQEFAAEVQTRRGPLPYIRPPFEALLFSLFAAWPYATALLLWTGVKLVLLAAIPFVVIRRRSWEEPFPRWVTGLLVVGTFPEFMDLLMGQDAVLLTFLFAVAFWQLETGKDMGAGVTLGLALFKFQLVIPFVVTLWIAGRKRVLPGFATSAAAVTAISAVMVGWRGLLHYPVYLLALNRASGGEMVSSEQQMNLRGLLTLIVGRSAYPGRIHWGLAPVALVAIVYAGLSWRKAGDRLLAEGFGLALIITILTSYYAYDYDLLLLIVPLFAMWVRSTADAPKVDSVTRCCEAAGLVLLLTPVYWLMKAELHAEYLMTLPLVALGVALARRLRHAGLGMRAAQRAPLPGGSG